MIKVSKKHIDSNQQVIVVLPKNVKEDGGAYVYASAKIMGKNSNFVFVQYPGDGKQDVHAVMEDWLHLPENCWEKDSKLYWKE